MKRLKIELENLKNDNGRIIVLPTIVFAIDTEDEEFGLCIGCLWYVLTITYFYG